MKPVIILAALLLTTLSSCTAAQPSQLDTRTLIGARDTLTHLRMLDGSTGETRIFPPGPEMTAALGFITALDAQLETQPEPRTGYLYWIAGYRDGEEAFRLQFGGEVVNVDGAQYWTERNLTSTLNALYESVPFGNLVDMAMADLAAELNLPVDEIVPVSVEAHTFPDASLGVPQEDMLYAQVETPGYIIALETDGENYVYHGAGAKVIRVE